MKVAKKVGITFINMIRRKEGGVSGDTTSNATGRSTQEDELQDIKQEQDGFELDIDKTVPQLQMPKYDTAGNTNDQLEDSVRISEYEDQDGYETELEELYTAYSRYAHAHIFVYLNCCKYSQYIRDQNYNLFEARYKSKKGMNIGKFGRFCADFGMKITVRKINKIYNKLVM